MKMINTEFLQSAYSPVLLKLVILKAIIEEGKFNNYAIYSCACFSLMAHVLLKLISLQLYFHSFELKFKFVLKTFPMKRVHLYAVRLHT
jgi:hypothetical protein